VVNAGTVLNAESGERLNMVDGANVVSVVNVGRVVNMGNGLY
jgi:hypothetical protein